MSWYMVIYSDKRPIRGVPVTCHGVWLYTVTRGPQRGVSVTGNKMIKKTGQNRNVSFVVVMEIREIFIKI